MRQSELRMITDQILEKWSLEPEICIEDTEILDDAEVDASESSPNVAQGLEPECSHHF